MVCRDVLVWMQVRRKWSPLTSETLTSSKRAYEGLDRPDSVQHARTVRLMASVLSEAKRLVRRRIIGLVRHA